MIYVINFFFKFDLKTESENKFVGQKITKQLIITIIQLIFFSSNYFNHSALYALPFYVFLKWRHIVI